MRPAPTCLAASLLGLLATTPASANPRADVRVIVLRATSTTRDIERRVDHALVAALSAEAGFGRAEVSPVPLADLGLAAGCDDRSRACLTRIAGTVDADVVIVRDLAVGDARPVLALTSFDAIGIGAPIYVERPIEEEPDDEVATMVRELYVPIDEGGAAAVHPRSAPLLGAPGRSADTWSSAPTVSPVTWASLGLGAAAVGTAAVLGTMAQSAHDDYAAAEIGSDADADRALDRLDTAEDRALAANILYGAGGALLAAGAILLILDLTGSDDAGVAVGASAGPTGAGLTVRATTEVW